MPIYEYRCAKCGCQFESLVLSADEKVQCNACGSEEVQRQMSCFSMAGGGAVSSLGVGVPPSGGGGCGGGGGFT